MKCDEYKILIDKLIDDEASQEQKTTLLKHIEHCEQCSQEYKATLSYLSLTSELHKAKPILENKNVFIDDVFDKLPDIKEDTKSAKTIRLWLTDSRFRKTIASLAAALVLFFMAQQTHDAWQVKQLEEKIATKHFINKNTLAYEQSFIELFTKIESNNENKVTLSKYKTFLFKKSILKIGNKYDYKQLEISKILIK